MEMRRYLSLVSMALIMFSFITGCVSGRKHDDLEKKYQSALSNLSRANEEKENLQDRVADLEGLVREQQEASQVEIQTLKDTYDELVSSLESEVASGKVEIQQVQDRLQLTLAERVFFDTGRAEIKPEGQAVLRRIGPILRKIPQKNIRIEGHTDTVPIGPSLRMQFPTNWELGAIRAVNVARFLQKESGIDPLRLSAVSYGQYRPVASNRTESGRARNRRIEIVLVDRDMEMVQRYRRNLPAE